MKSFELIKIIGTLTDAVKTATVDLYGEVLDETFGGFIISDPEVRAIREMELDIFTLCLNKAVKCGSAYAFTIWLNEQQGRAFQLMERNAECGRYAQMLLCKEKAKIFGEVSSMINDYCDSDNVTRPRHPNAVKKCKSRFVDKSTSIVDKEY